MNEEVSNKVEENKYELITLEDLEELEDVVCPLTNGCCGCC